MKAVVGEDALTTDDKNYLLFLEKFENQFLQQGKYEKRDIFRSLEGAWDLLRRFEKKALTKIGDQDVLRKYYDRKGAIQR
jgi:V-type H+-transporting ATPase subunit B